MIEALADLLDRAKRTIGVPRLAARLGAGHLCLFVCDPELHRFLPAPGFPQRLPDGLQWTGFLDIVAAQGSAQQDLLCPFTRQRCHVSAFLLDDLTIAAFLGGQLDSEAYHLLNPGLRLAGALLAQEVHTRLAQIRASLSDSFARESHELANALSEAHDKLITALHARELLIQEVNRKQEQLQLAGRISGIGLWELDILAGQLSLSPEAASIFGLPHDSLQRPLADLLRLVHSDDCPSVSRELAAIARTSQELNFQFRLLAPDGATRWIENRAAAHDSPAGPVLTGLSLDVTQRVLTEQTLLRTEKLAAAGRLAASIAHEINNPLGGLVNLVYLARNSSNLKQIHLFLQTIDSELARLSAVARQSLAFYRDINHAVRFDLAATLRECLTVLEKQIRGSAVAVIPEIPEGQLEIDGWPGEIKQAFSNLLLNAIQACPPGSFVRLRLHGLDRRVRVIVADPGHGIAPEHLARIFEPFFTTRREFGTGLGLWVTNQIVNKHHGSIRLRTSARSHLHGTVFAIDFPAAGTIREFSAEPHLRDRWRQLSA